MFFWMIVFPVVVIWVLMVMKDMSGVRRVLAVLGLSMVSTLCFELLSAIVIGHGMFSAYQAAFWAGVHSLSIFVISMLTLLWSDKKAREAD